MLGRIALLINESLLAPAKALWDTLGLLPPTVKHLEKWYFIPMQGFEGFYPHLSANSPMVTAANARARQGRYKPTPKDKESKRMDFMRRKIYTSCSRQMYIMN